MLTRRELLATFLGAAVASCAKNESIAIPPGELVGASHDVGHRLRGAPPPRPDSWEVHDIVIVGGGIAGLSAAWRLVQRGDAKPLVLELEPVAGGTSRSGSNAVSAYPWGAHYLPAPASGNPDLVALLRELGAVEGEKDGEPVFAEELLCREPEERVFYRGRWYEGLYLRAGASDDDLRQLARFDAEVARWVGRRSFAVPIAHGADDPQARALDAMSMAEWLDRNRFTSPRLRWLVEYGTRDDYGTLLADTSAWAGLFYFAARVKKPGDESQPFIVWPEGNGRLVAHLAKSARVEAGWLVADVNPTDAGVEVTAVSRDGRTLRGIRARKVIFAAPQFIAGHVIRPWREQRPAHLAEFSYGSWMVANITLRDRPKSIGYPLSWDNVLYDSPSLGYVVATHQRGVEHGPTVITYYHPLCDPNPRASRERLLSANREEWADVALTDLERAHPEIRKLAERVDVMRWGHAMIRPRPGFVWSAARRGASQPYRDVHFAHSDLSGMGLFEEAFFHGLRAADEVTV
jgi:glycine/D-amino acid oxidase-like deaminating enzyme